MGRNNKEYIEKLNSISKSDLENLYLHELKTVEELANLYDVKYTSMYKLLKKYNIVRNCDQKAEARENGFLKKYGVRNPFQAEEIKIKCGDTKFERYGDRNYRDLNKLKQTNLERYGVEHNWASKDPKLNGRETCYKKFGSEENFYKHVQEKGKLTKLELYGDANFNNRTKSNKTSFERYGVLNNFNIYPERKNTPDVIKKILQTKLKNKTFNTSKPEDEMFEELKKQYGEDDVVHIYNADKRYAFNCDFYIKSLDQFIELNLHPSHGTHPFDETNEEDLKLREELESKGDDWSRMILDTWCDRDVRKIRTAKENNLNYLAIYNKGVIYEHRASL